MKSSRVPLDDIQREAQTLIAVLREQPDEAHAVVALVDYMLTFQERIHHLTILAIRSEILAPLIIGLEDRANAKPS